MNTLKTDKICLWCLQKEPSVAFIKKAHTIPKSLGGQNFNKNVCDECNYYFGNRDTHNGKYSLEVALKEAFTISRKRFLLGAINKKKVGEFKSQFFEIKERNGKYRLAIKTSFMFTSQSELCRAFKRGLYKMCFEELNRQKKIGFESSFDIIRNFARFNIGDLPVLYFTRKYGIMMFFKSEAETPVLFFDRMNYLYSDTKFIEIEFLGHVFGFPIAEYSKDEFEAYTKKSIEIKKDFFIEAKIIDKFIDIDIALNIMNN